MESRTIEIDYLHYSEYTGFSDQLLLEALKIDYDTDVPSDVSFHDLNKYFAFICWVKNDDNTGHYYTILRNSKNRFTCWTPFNLSQ